MKQIGEYTKIIGHLTEPRSKLSSIPIEMGWSGRSTCDRNCCAGSEAGLGPFSELDQICLAGGETELDPFSELELELGRLKSDFIL